MICKRSSLQIKILGGDTYESRLEREDAAFHTGLEK